MPRPDPSHAPARADAPVGRTRRMLVCCDDAYHPGANVRAGLAPLLTDGGWTVDWLDGETLAALRSPMDAYAIVVIVKSNVVSRERAQVWVPPEDVALTDYVRAGGRVLFVHSGLAGYERASAMRQLAGGAFVHHPPMCEVTLEVRPGHPIADLPAEAFPVFDEHYCVTLDDPGADVFLIARSEHGTQPAGWTRVEGRGRVCAITPGHTVEVWRNPGVQRLFHHALRWLEGRDDPRVPHERPSAP